MKIIIVVLIFAGSFFLILLTGNVIKFLTKRHLKWKFLFRLFPLIELAIGLFVILWSINFLFHAKSYYNILLICLAVIFIVLLSWFLLRDLVAGYIFRMQNSFRPGAEIQLGKSIGRLLSMRATHIIIETGDGRTVKIPYSLISNEIVSEQREETIAEDSSFTLRFSCKKNIQKTEKDIRKAVLNSPWRLLHREPVIKLKSENEDSFEFEIQVKTRNKKHLQYLYNSLLIKFKD